MWQISPQTNLITAFVFGIIEGPEEGWTEPLTLGALALGILAGVAFVAVMRATRPLAFDGNRQETLSRRG